MELATFKSHIVANENDRCHDQASSSVEIMALSRACRRVEPDAMVSALSHRFGHALQRQWPGRSRVVALHHSGETMTEKAFDFRRLSVAHAACHKARKDAGFATQRSSR